MRLIGCHIENFGKFADEDFAFHPGCNVICRENGAGKSTLAAFIRVMLFGFDNERAKKLEDREREQFRPWQHGVYGGALEFEAGGKRYVLSRTFGQKDREDTFELRDKDTNLESRDFTENVGEELFQLDRASFSRTVFISQNDCAARTTDRINAKIGNLAENTDDINNYEAADAKLGDLLNKMSPSRATGSIRKMEREEAALLEQVRTGRDIGPSIDRLTARIRELREEQASLRLEQADLYRQQKTVSRYKDIQADKKKYADLCQEAEDRAAAVSAAEGCFPGQIPDGEELKRYMADSAGLSAPEEKMRIFRMTEEERRQANRLDRLFADGCPAEEEIAVQRAALKDLWKTELDIAQNRTGRKKGAMILLFFAAVLAAAAGILCLVSGNEAAGACLLGAGALAGAAAGYCFLRLRGENAGNRRLEERKDRLAEELQAFCGRFYAVSSEKEQFDSALRQLEEDLREYGRLSEKKAEYVAAYRHDAEQRERICGYLKKLSVSPKQDLSAQLAELRDRLQRYQTAQAEFERARGERADFERTHDIEEFLGFDSSMLERLPLLERIGDRLEAISARLTEIEGELHECDRQLDGLQARQNQMAENEQALSELREKLSADRRKYELLKKTREFLAKARESFTARYTGPLMESFGKYYRILAGEEAKRYHLDANIRLTADEKGQQRQIRSFSAGYQDMTGICMRMALIDAMYREEKPFVVFDDPFVNLDREKVAGGLEFLKEIGREYQILYFTCHESRAG